jgi:hypothetical protein
MLYLGPVPPLSSDTDTYRLRPLRALFGPCIIAINPFARYIVMRPAVLYTFWTALARTVIAPVRQLSSA